MPDTAIPDAPNEADDLRREMQALQAELARLRAAPVMRTGPAGTWPGRSALVPGQPGGALSRRLAFRAYRVVRPIVRPLAWRIRSFLLGPVLQDLAELRQQLQGQRPFTAFPASSTPNDPGLAQAVERLLLTLALEERVRPDPR